MTNLITFLLVVSPFPYFFVSLFVANYAKSVSKYMQGMAFQYSASGTGLLLVCADNTRVKSPYGHREQYSCYRGFHVLAVLSACPTVKFWTTKATQMVVKTM